MQAPPTGGRPVVARRSAPTSSSSPPSRRGRLHKLAKVAAASAMTLCFCSVSPSSSVSGFVADDEVIRFPDLRPTLTVPALVGELRQTVSLTGELQCVDTAVVESACRWGTYLTDILPEGTYVKEGDIVARLNDSEVVERLLRYEVRAVEGRAAVRQAKEGLATQELENERLLAKAELDLRLAELDLIAYQEAALPAERSAKSGSVALAKEAVSRAAKRVDYASRMARKGYMSLNDVESERMALHRAEHRYRVAAVELDLLEQYGQDRKLDELQAAVQTARDELQRATDSCGIRTESRRIAVVSAEQRQTHYEERLTMAEESLAACTVRAPRDGRVMWARTYGRRGFSTMEPGESVYEKQAIFEIPRFDVMLVKIRIPESQMRLVQPGQPASVRLQSQPDVVLAGTVQKVASVPTSDNYPNYDRRIYAATVLLKTADLDQALRPGLTAAVAINCDSRSNCLKVPVQSVVEVNGESVVFVDTDRGLEVRPVRLGLTATAFREITDGVSEGESVVLSPRDELTEQLLELWQQPA